MSIYLSSGYIDIDSILSQNLPFNFIIGGRGTGKTYGALKAAYVNDIRFMLMRRTQSQCDLINKPEFNPYKAVCADLSAEISVRSISKYNSIIYEQVSEDSEKLLGYTCALSTIANLRGFDASDVQLMIYDEFIPERHERAMKNEGSAFLNAYETINRNRELKGQDPLQVLAMANAFDIANAIFLELGLVGICEKMQLKGQEVYINRERGVQIVLLQDSKISRAKADTALYKVASGSFADMSLVNDFVYNDRSDVKSLPLKSYRLICVVGEIAIYKHKSMSEYYVSEHKTGSAVTYGSDEIGVKRYQKRFGMRLFSAYMHNNVRFESILTKSLFELYTI